MAGHIQILGMKGFEYYHLIENQKDLDKIKKYINEILTLSDILDTQSTEQTNEEKK